MKERPILFSAPMVRALLDGSKTQTRRIVKQELHKLGDGDWYAFDHKGINYRVNARRTTVGAWAKLLQFSPYGKPGDHLWVRETFKKVISGEVKNGYGELRYGWAYAADSTTIWNEQPTIVHDLTGQPATGAMQFQVVPWKPSIYMPRRASRILLEIVGVHVERVQDISEEDAKNEGADCLITANCTQQDRALLDMPLMDDSTPYRNGYALLWECINGDGAWGTNPWVWVIEFKVIKP